jgi:hypothetical protein
VNAVTASCLEGRAFQDWLGEVKLTDLALPLRDLALQAVNAACQAFPEAQLVRFWAGKLGMSDASAWDLMKKGDEELAACVVKEFKTAEARPPARTMLGLWG